MFYFDTSFVAPLILEELSSRRIQEFVVQLANEKWAVSHWTCVEFSSLLAREVRMRRMVQQDALEADNRFRKMIAESFVELSPTRDDFDLAGQYLRNYATGLRAGDALHLAVARNHHVRTLYTLDKTMLKAGLLLGLPIKDTEMP
ncbi:MAG: type II toxin-antitoxin system VapC family toxin [Magnetococcales bacterium]|nr:type II toxin-antitoxin system VapC family toxin [Magnetococcales bacterium]